MYKYIYLRRKNLKLISIIFFNTYLPLNAFFAPQIVEKIRSIKTKRDCNSPPFIIRSVYVMNPLLSTSRENQSRKEIKPQETPITEIN